MPPLDWWENVMTEIIETDICVVGGGSGGLSIAAGAAQMGAAVVLVEGHKMGGDCLNYGCVPSKALLAAAHHAASDGDAFGVAIAPPKVRYAQVMRHVRDVIDGIAPIDSVERFTGLGVRVIEAAGRFVDADTLAAGKFHIRAKRFVIATGSRPAIPPIAGLKSVPYLTNETIFDGTRRPSHLLIVGGGPIGMEMAQAHVRLGSKVTVFEAMRVLGREDPELAAPVIAQLEAEGVRFVSGAPVAKVSKKDGKIRIRTETETIEGSHLLVAAGRAPNIETLNLEAAGVATERGAIAADRRLRTHNRRIFAIGDVIGGPQFTHAASYHAGIVMRNILFHIPARVNYAALPRVTYTAPELAAVGVNEAEARAQNSAVKVLRWPFKENDRARAERDTAGAVKIVTARNGRILGAGIVGANAGDLLAPWTLAISQGLRIGAMAGVVAPYPTRGEASKRAAGDFYTPTLFSPRTRAVVRALSWFRR